MKTEEATAPPPTSDVLGRDEDVKKRDRWFASNYTNVSKGEVSLLPADRFAFARKNHFVEIVRKGADAKSDILKIPLRAAVYDRLAVEQRLKVHGRDKTLTPEAISKLLYDEAGFKRMITVSHDQASSVSAKLAPISDGAVNASSNFLGVLQGTTVLFDEDGKPPTHGVITSTEEYLKFLPLMRAGWHHQNTWCLDFPCEEVAFLADQAPDLLARLRAQLKVLPGVELYTIVPRWLRYYSDGDMGSQRSGAYGIRNAPYGEGRSMRPLLYDGPAWAIGLKFGDAYMPGRAYLNPSGAFVCSDWCQREVDKGGGIDLHTGENTKHNLLTWSAGPGLSRFGDATAKVRAGSVRPVNADMVRAQLKGKTKKAKPALKSAKMLPGSQWVRSAEMQDVLLIARAAFNAPPALIEMPKVVTDSEVLGVQIFSLGYSNIQRLIFVSAIPGSQRVRALGFSPAQPTKDSAFHNIYNDLAHFFSAYHGAGYGFKVFKLSPTRAERYLADINAMFPPVKEKKS